MCAYPLIEFSNPKELSGTYVKDERDSTTLSVFRSPWCSLYPMNTVPL